jgi:RNA polymerase sigma factor (sigma-70 family)
LNAPPLSDHQLLLQYRWGSDNQKKQASIELHDRHVWLVRSHVEHLFPTLKNDVEDIAQEVFSRFFVQAAMGVIQAAGLRAWLLRTARNRAIDWLRHVRRGGRNTYTLDGLDENRFIRDETCPEDDVVHQDLLAYLLQSLPAEQRAVWNLHEQEGRPLWEVAEHLGWFTKNQEPNVSRVFRVLVRARAHLVRLMEESASG